MSDVSLSAEARRGVLRFYFAPGMGLFLRTALFILLATAGASIMFRFHWAAGAPVYIAGLYVILARGVDNSRRSPDTKKDRWVVGTAKDLRKIERKAEQAKSLPANALDGFSGWGFLTLLLFGAALIIVDTYILPEALFAEYIFSILFMQGSALLAIFYSATASAWEPSNIIRKKDLFIRERDMILERWKELNPVARPMLLLDEGDPEMITPEDIKLFITFQEAPEDFIGVQAQITFNMGQPYLYCVVLAKESFAPLKNYKPDPAKKITFERGSQGGVRFLVVRQTTTRDSGYSTSGVEADAVVNKAMEIAKGLLEK